MKILIVGAGVIGASYGWALSKAGHDVTHFVKPAQDAGALWEAMQKTAQELNLDLPCTKALDVYLQTK
jgi:ketopantoate reductase